jgi:hypothetical protein
LVVAREADDLAVAQMRNAVGHLDEVGTLRALRSLAPKGATGFADDLLRTGDDVLDAQILALRNELRQLGVQTPNDKALFWSGSIKKANAFAIRERLVTLEMTEAGGQTRSIFISNTIHRVRAKSRAISWVTTSPARW